MPPRRQHGGQGEGMTTRDELLVKLRDLKAREDGKYNPSSPYYRLGEDEETWHAEADTAIVDYLNDDEIAEAYGVLGKWYA